MAAATLREVTVDRTASRQAEGDASWTAISPEYEVRYIVVARGLQFHNDRAGDFALPDYLIQKLGSDVVVLDDGLVVYANDDQHVTYVLQQVTTKTEFKTALMTPGLLVVYCGHARFGQGMCFGDHSNDDDGNLVPGEDWGAGTDRCNTGLFRAGFPYIALPVTSDILEHGYQVEPVSGLDDKPNIEDCHPHARAHHAAMQPMDIDSFDPELTRYIGAADTQSGLWGFDATSEAGRFERHLLVRAGWAGTAEDPMDLGATEMACKGFVCIACSTVTHHYPVFRRLCGWKRQGDERYAYWTTNVTESSVMTALFIHRLLSYPDRNDFMPWAGALDHAVRLTNQDYLNTQPPFASRLY